MSVLLETSLGDMVVDLDVEGSPLLVKNFLRLCQARYYTQTLFNVVVPNRCVYGGDPRGDGTGGACADALLQQFKDHDEVDDVNEEALLRSKARFLTSQGRRLTPEECREKGRLVAVELGGIANTVGSQFLLTVASGAGQALDGYTPTYKNTPKNVVLSSGWLSLGQVVEDNDNVLDQLNRTYLDASGRPWADIRLRRALVVYNPFSDSMDWPVSFLRMRGIEIKEDEARVIRSPSPERPVNEAIQPRIPMEDVLEELKDADGERDHEAIRRRLRAEAEADRRQEDKSRARVLEMLGDLPDAEATAPKNVLFVAKLNPITTDEDLQLIFSRFDSQVKVDIIRDSDTGQSLQYAFCAFTTEEQAVAAYFKMNNALVDDRRILVDFSQSVSHVWDKYRQQYRNMPKANSFSINRESHQEGKFGQRQRQRRDYVRGGDASHPHNRDRHRTSEWKRYERSNPEHFANARHTESFPREERRHQHRDFREREESDESTDGKGGSHGFQRRGRGRSRSHDTNIERTGIRNIGRDSGEREKKGSHRRRSNDSGEDDELNSRRKPKKRSRSEQTYSDSSTDRRRRKKKQHKRHKSHKSSSERPKNRHREDSTDDEIKYKKRDRHRGEKLSEIGKSDSDQRKRPRHRDRDQNDAREHPR